MGQQPEQSESPTTTAATAVPGSATTTAATSTNAGTSAVEEHVEGTYEGFGQYRLFTEECADLEHHLELTLTLSDGSPWQYETDHCATIDQNNVWTGTGTFLITAEDASTLLGEFVSTAQLPTEGVPYSLTITGGTGRYSGAYGQCALTIHVVDTNFGEQQQSGTFSCDLAHD